MKFRSLIFVVIAGLTLTCCGPTYISTILRDPAHYRDRQVQITGVVTGSAGALSAGGYQVDDGTGRIIVISTRGVPRQGTRVAVKGKVLEGVTIGTHSFGTAIEERNHKVQQ